MKTLSVGLLLDGVHSDKYVEELALWGRSQPDIDISHLIVHPCRKRRLHLLPARAAFRAILRLERLLLRWSAPHKDHHAVRDLSKIVDRIVEIRSDEDVAGVEAIGLDLLISCGSAMPRGGILGASRLGVIAFSHGESGRGQAAPPGFWECYYRQPQTGFSVRRLSEDAADVLVAGCFRTHFYYSLNQAHVAKKTLTHLKSLLKKAASTGELPAAQRAPGPSSNAALRAPGLAHCMLYGCKLLKRISIKAIARIPALRERFGISVLPGRWNEAITSRITAAPLPRGRYWADPFLCTRGGRTFCFVEELDRKTNKGHISALEIIGTRIVERGIALQEPFHLSFPFLFEYRGGLYMCPESSGARQIRVYRCTEFPLQWKLEQTLMDGVSAADAMLFQRGGKWWMLASIDESETGDHCSELYLFSADSPLSTTWVPHPQNPLLVDSIGGRNGGLILDGERLFRLGQCQGFDQYGKSLRVYEIREVSESRYAEELVAQIEPDFGKGIVGTHHLSTDGRTTVIDYARGVLVS